MRTRRHAAALALAALLGLAVGACGGGDAPELEGPAPTPSRPVDGHLVLILDTSGSMNESVQGEDRSRFEVAQDVLLNDFVPLISDDLALALCVFSGDEPQPLTQLVRAGDFVQPKWRHKEWVMEKIEESSSRASTPIVDSLLWAQGTLEGQKGPRIVVLITDGEETERPNDVGSTVDRLVKSGIELYAIGFNIGGGGRELARKLGGRYIEATGGRDVLQKALRSVLTSIER